MLHLHQIRRPLPFLFISSSFVIAAFAVVLQIEKGLGAIAIDATVQAVNQRPRTPPIVSAAGNYLNPIMFPAYTATFSVPSTTAVRAGSTGPTGQQTVNQTGTAAIGQPQRPTAAIYYPAIRTNCQARCFPMVAGGQYHRWNHRATSSSKSDD